MLGFRSHFGSSVSLRHYTVSVAMGRGCGWSSEEETKLQELLAAGTKRARIARLLKRPISSTKKAIAKVKLGTSIVQSGPNTKINRVLKLKPVFHRRVTQLKGTAKAERVEYCCRMLARVAASPRMRIRTNRLFAEVMTQWSKLEQNAQKDHQGGGRCI